MPLVLLLDTLRERDFVFVMDNDRARYILTRADLAKPQAGLTVLAYLLAMEQELLPLAIDRLGGDWFTKLPYDSLSKAERLFRDKLGGPSGVGA